MVKQAILTSQVVKQIKSHLAYNFNVHREEEANMTLIDNHDGTFTIDDWGLNSRDSYGNDFFRGAKLDGLTLKQALDTIQAANNFAERHDFFTATWNIKGL